MANFTQRMYLENYHPDEKTTVVDLNQHALTIINGPHDEVETAFKKGKKVVVVPGKHYVAGPIVDRLAEFEAIGLEPDDIKSLMAAHSDLLEKYGPKKVVVKKSFRHSTDMMPFKQNNCTLYSYVDETRHYRCPACGNELARRCKVTKLYPNGTVGIESENLPVKYHNREHCAICSQSLDWSDVDKETWA